MIRHLNKIKENLRGRYIALFIDYDGTLSPIVSRPEKAYIPKGTRRLLRNLSGNSKCKIAVISGRSLRNIKKKVGIKGLTYAGNHGLEVEGPDIRLKKPISRRYKKVLQHIKDELSVNLFNIKGVLLEDKGFSLSVHYRLVDMKKVPQVKAVLYRVTSPYKLKGEIKIKLGKKVFEIRAALDWDKGKVILWLLKKWEVSFKNKEIMPIYIGDDVTDEDAFKVLKNKGIGIFVGKPDKRSHAKYYLKNPKEVKDFFTRLEKLFK